MSLRSLLQEATEKLPTGIALMDKLSECLMEVRLERSMLSALLKMVRTLFLVVKTRELNSGTTMKESAITKELAILEILPRFKSHQIKKLWSQLEQREQFSCGTCLKKSSLVNKIKTKLEQR